MVTSRHLTLLRNHIDIKRIPFGDRGSQLLAFRTPDRSRLLLKLAKRLTERQPDIEAYLRRPLFIDDLCLVDEEGEALDFEVVSYPHALCFHTRLGDLGLVFQDKCTLAFALPSQVTKAPRRSASDMSSTRRYRWTLVEPFRSCCRMLSTLFRV